jgi:transcriptional regulator with XRE-family HTH domain
MSINSIGNKIVAARKHKGLSQEALAAVANISLSTIQRIEKGAVQPRSFTLKTLANALEIDFTELIAQEETTPKTVVDSSEQEIPLLKRMLMFGMLGTLFPLCNIIIPFVFFKKKKTLLSTNVAAGSILSFQILWTMTVVLSIFLTELVIYLITGLEGYRPFPVEFFLYILFVIVNLFISLKQVTKLNATNQKILSFVPNFF